MAGKHNHIEDVFKTAFEDHAVKPPKSAWSGMKSSLDNMRVEYLTKNQLGNFSAKPSASLWSRIAKKLWWQQFMRFNPAHINIYYVGLALVGGTAAVVSLTEPPATPPVPESVFSVEDAFFIEKTNVLNPEKREEKQQNADFMALGSDIAETASTENEMVSASTTYNSNEDQKTENIRILKHKDVDARKEQIKSNTEETEAFTRVVISAEQREISDESDAQKQNAGINTSIPAHIVQKKEKEPLPLVKLPSRLPLPVPVNSAWLVGNLSDITMRHDTLAYNFAGEPIVKDINFFEQGWYGGMYFLTQDIAFLNEEVKEIYEQNRYYSNYSYSFGLRFNMVRNHFMMQTGIYFSSLNNVFEHAQQLMLIEDDIEGRVIWPYESDTIYHNTTHKYHNSYSYFEIPVLAGLHLEGVNFATNIKTGLMFNYITGVNANLVMYADNQLYSVDKSYFKHPCIRWEISADLIYKFGDHLSIFVEPSYVHDVTSMFKKEMDIRSLFKGFSVGMGVYYRF
ncbi:MAG: outer membrane beta-barrel protein [Bacteroidales bacterium]